MTANERPTLISSVQRALRLLEAASVHPNGAPAKQLARETGIAIGTTYHLLRTLVHDGYLQRLDDGGYVLGHRLESLQRDSREQAMLRRVRPALAGLRDELGAAAYLAFYDGGEIEVVEVVDSPKAPRAEVWVGFTEAGHATALGKCVLGNLSEAARTEYLSRHPLLDLTPHTITRRPDLLRQLELDRRSGLTLNQEEYVLGVSCAAMLVTDGVRTGSLAVAVPAARLGHVQAARHRLAAAAARISRTLSLTG
jgi:IclR family transcriptional regulator, acetate operon repressor